MFGFSNVALTLMVMKCFKIEPEDKTLAIYKIQRQAAKIALNLSADTLLLSAPAVIQNCKCYEVDLEETELIELSDPINICSGIEPSYILIPAHEDITIPTFLLKAECTWDIEHGLEIRFRHGYADKSDQRG